MAVAEGHVPRLLHLVRLLDKRGETTLHELADEMGTSTQEVEEDIRLLTTCGIPPYSPADLFEIEIDGEKVRLGHKLLSIPRFQLSAEEVAGLRLAARLAQSEGWGETRAIKRAITKLESALLPEERERGIRLARRIGLPARSQSLARQLELIEKAVHNQVEISMNYYSEHREKLTTRTVRPYRIIAAPESRYLIAYDLKARDIRTFRVDRIHRLKLTKKSFTVPEDFNIEDVLSDSQSDRRLDVVLRFDSQVARLALEQFRGGKEAKDGSVTVRLKVWPGPGFRRMVLSWAGNCEIVEPASEREALRAYAQDVVDNHQVR